MKSFLTSAAVVLLACPWAGSAGEIPASQVHDLSLFVSPELPCVWPVGMMQHLVTTTRSFGPSAYHREMIIIDEHTGTQWDAPAHFVPPPDSGLPGAGPMGLVTGDKVPAWQFAGEACVIDVTVHRDDAKPGHSFLITPEIVKEWETKHRPVGAGDVALFRSDYTDRYYQPLAQGGERFVHTVLRKTTPGWPGPTPECMKYLGEKGVMASGLDSASMGPVPDLAAATHQAGGKFGMIWVECATHLGELPSTGAFYALLPAFHQGGSGGEARVLGITEPTLAKRLIANARAKRVTDASVLLEEELPITWPGAAPGEEAQRYVGKTLNAFGRARGPYFARTHTLDSQVGTHLVTPSFTLPPSGFDNGLFSPRIRELREKFERLYGKLGHSDLTVDQVPLSQLMGEIRIIEVASLIGSTSAGAWPGSPRVTVDHIKAFAERNGAIQAGEIVLFRSGYSDKHLKPFPPQPEIDGMMAAPLAGKAEGWPAPTPEAVRYLADHGVRCLGTDGPTLGGADADQALLTYWAAATRGVMIVEFLTNLGKLRDKGGFFLFAPIKIKGARSGYGRALVLEDEAK